MAGIREGSLIKKALDVSRNNCILVSPGPFLAQINSSRGRLTNEKFYHLPNKIAQEKETS